MLLAGAQPLILRLLPLTELAPNIGKFCRLFAPLSESLPSLTVTPLLAKSIPNNELVKILFLLIKLPVPEVMAIALPVVPLIKFLLTVWLLPEMTTLFPKASVSVFSEIKTPPAVALVTFTLLVPEVSILFCSTETVLLALLTPTPNLELKI